jgi:plasmid stabilization system protein ParE
LFKHALVGLAFCLAAGISPGLVVAAEIRHLSVKHENPAYRVKFEAVVAVSPDRVFAVLTDYERLGRLNPGVKVAERLSASGPVSRVRTVIQGCVLFFCRRMERVEVVRTRHQRVIWARIVPDASDFRSGESRWRLAAVTGGTRIRLRLRVVPDFWVPPLIGPWMIERDLEDNLRILVRRLERLGQAG